MKITKIRLFGALAVVAVAVGFASFGSATPTSAQIPVGTTKTCTVPAGTTLPLAAAATVTCTLTIPAGATFANPALVTLTAPAPGPGVGFTSVAVTVGPPPATPAVAILVAAPPALGFVLDCTPAVVCVGPITVTETLTVPAGTTAISQTFDDAVGVATPLPTATITALAGPIVFGGVTPGGPFPVSITLVGCQTVVTGGAFLTTGATTTTVTQGTTAICRFDLDDNEPGFLGVLGTGGPTTSAGTTTCVAATATFPTTGAITTGGATALPASECVSSGQIVGTFGSTISGLTIGGVSVTAGLSFTARCPGGTTTGPNACDFIDVPVTVSSTANLTAFTLTLNYDPDIDAQNTGAQTTFTLTVVSPVITPNVAFPRVVCFASVRGAFAGFTLGSALIGLAGQTAAVSPGQLAVNNLVEVSVLPSPINCSISFFTALTGGTQIAIPAGTIEVSSLNGALIDASGRLSTNLRIGCGTGLGISTGVGIGGTTGTPIVTDAVNNCIGVTFSVAGTGVGISEIRFRYEPLNSNFNEFEGAFAVAFVAPTSSLSLTLSPNPVSAGGTSTAGTATSDGTATLTINPNFAANLFRDPTTGQVFVNPSTGQPFLLNTGSILNGSVIFTIDNTAIARFVGSGIANLGTTTTTGGTTTTAGITNTTTAVAATSDTVIVRCGSLSQTISTTAISNLQSFFGGCTTASVAYRGIVAGSANITATFIPDLPGAVNNSVAGLGLTTSAFTGFSALNFSGFSAPFVTQQLQVLDAPVSGNINLVRGCNNVSPTVTESISAFLARVSTPSVVLSVFEYQAATNTFLGAPGGAAPAGAPGDLAGVTRLRPVFICVNAAATLSQPAA